MAYGDRLSPIHFIHKHAAADTRVPSCIAGRTCVTLKVYPVIRAEPGH